MKNTLDTATLTVDQANALKLAQFQEIANAVANMVNVIGNAEALYYPAPPSEYRDMTLVCVNSCDSLARQMGLGSFLQATGQVQPIPNYVAPLPSNG